MPVTHVDSTDPKVKRDSFQEDTEEQTKNDKLNFTLTLPNRKWEKIVIGKFLRVCMKKKKKERENENSHLSYNQKLAILLLS